LGGGAVRPLGTPTTVLRLPWEIYPKESMENHEVDKVVMQLAFDPDRCVREARILQSSGYYRLDNVSLGFAMTLKFSFKVVKRVDDEPTITFPIVWDANRQKRLLSRLDQMEWTQ
jgi:outer membrane biosynthesis protein TonB